MIKIAFFDTKPYDRRWFDRLAGDYGCKIKYFETKLTADTAITAQGYDAVVAFVNDVIDAPAVDRLMEAGVRLIALRSAGYNNVDFRYACDKIPVVRVPAYSPSAVAEHAAALLLTLARKTHRAYVRTREFNFNISGLDGFDLHGKTVGVVGTGRIGQAFISICRGLGMRVLAHDPYPVDGLGLEYVPRETIWRESDVISLHCPLTPDTHHLVNADTIAQMKEGVILLNTSRGALIDSEALLEGLKSHKVGAAGLDVYEEESDLFFEDFSNSIIQDDTLSLLLSLPNVLITSHQAFLTDQALHNIAQTTLENIHRYFDKGELVNEICYHKDK